MGKDMSTKLHLAYCDMQSRVNMLFDSEKAPPLMKADATPGFRQLIEKKQGTNLN